MAAHNGHSVDPEPHNPTLSGTSSHRGRTVPVPRGGRVPAGAAESTSRAERSNNPLRAPPTIKPQSAAWRRWRDLASHYAALLGPQRLRSEATISVLYHLLWITSELDRLRDDPGGPGGASPVTLMVMARQQERLLRALGLFADSNGSRPHGALGEILRQQPDD